MKAIIDHPLQHRGEHPGRQPYGFLVHQCGDGPASRAAKKSTSVLEEAHAWYTKIDKREPGRGPAALIGPSGQVIQYRDPLHRSQHVQMKAHHRRDYLTGGWKTSPRGQIRGPDWADLVAQWLVRYGDRYKSPAHLYPSVNPSDDYVGIELTPCGTYNGGKWEWLWGTRPRSKSRFSVEQYLSLASLLAAWGTLGGLPGGWHEAGSGRLVGHEDVNPYTRPGWDPGSARGWFHWPTLRAQIGLLL
jgi:hypothetical protein